MSNDFGENVAELLKMQEKLAAYLAVPKGARDPDDAPTITADYGYALNAVVLGLVRRVS